MKKRVLSMIALFAITVSMAGCSSSCEASGGDDANDSGNAGNVITVSEAQF